MGYEEGSIALEDYAPNFRLPVESNVGFSANEVQCKGREKNIKECKQVISNFQCQHNQDVVIACSKGNGDPTGKSQYNKPIPNNPPALSKRGVIKLNISCDDRGNLAIFRGDPGSVYLVHCPKHCGRTKGSIWGTGIYTSNSSVCRAAIHAGVLDDSIGGSFAYVKSWGQKNYEANELNSIKSFEYNGSWKVSFFISRQNSGWVNMNKYHTGALGSFIQKSSQISLVNESNSFLSSNWIIPRSHRYYSSFTETKSEEIYIPKPVFQWLPPVSTFKFSDQISIIHEQNGIGNLNKFTFLASFMLSDFKGKKAYIFSHVGCKGLNVYIDDKGSLVIGDFCTDNRYINTNIMVPLNDKILLYVQYIKGKTNLIYKSTLYKYCVYVVENTARKVPNLHL